MEYGYGYRQYPPCANCGKPNSGYMSSSEWGHDEWCCSDNCGKRLGKRIENGMVNIKKNSFGVYDNSEQINDLRFRIKHLEKQLRLVGVKPIRTIMNKKERQNES